MLRQDFLIRALEQLGAALARLVGDKAAEPTAILEEVAAAKRALPLVPGLVDEAAPRALASSLQSPELLRCLALLFRVEGEAHKRLGDTQRAVFCMRRSLALFEELGTDAAPTPRKEPH